MLFGRIGYIGLDDSHLGLIPGSGGRVAALRYPGNKVCPAPSRLALSPDINISPAPMVTCMGLSFLSLFPEFPLVPSAG